MKSLCLPLAGLLFAMPTPGGAQGFEDDFSSHLPPLFDPATGAAHFHIQGRDSSLVAFEDAWIYHLGGHTLEIREDERSVQLRHGSEVASFPSRGHLRASWRSPAWSLGQQPDPAKGLTEVQKGIIELLYLLRVEGKDRDSKDVASLSAGGLVREALADLQAMGAGAIGARIQEAQALRLSQATAAAPAPAPAPQEALDDLQAMDAGAIGARIREAQALRLSQATAAAPTPAPAPQEAPAVAAAAAAAAHGNARAKAPARNAKSFTCRVCQKPFTARYLMGLHEEAEHPNRFHCGICDYRFGDAKGLAAHLERKHSGATNSAAAAPFMGTKRNGDSQGVSAEDTPRRKRPRRASKASKAS